MEDTDGEISDVLVAQLTAAEREHGVAYELVNPVHEGATLEFPSCKIHVPWTARLAFIDGDPRANWGHPCRYVLINGSTGETLSVDARFPPMSSGRSGDWRLAYRAPGVPAAALLVPP